MITRFLAEGLLLSIIIGAVFLFYRLVFLKVKKVEEGKIKESKTNGSE